MSPRSACTTASQSKFSSSRKTGRSGSRFLAEIKNVLDRLPRRDPWYPGTSSKLSAVQSAYPHAQQHEGRFLIEVRPRCGEDAFSTEYVAPVLAYTALPGNLREFIRSATELANTDIARDPGAEHPRQAVGSCRARSGFRPNARRSALRNDRRQRLEWCWLHAARSVIGCISRESPVRRGQRAGRRAQRAADPGRRETVITGPFRPFPHSVLNAEWCVLRSRSGSSHRTLPPPFAERLTAFENSPSWRRPFATALPAYRA